MNLTRLEMLNEEAGRDLADEGAVSTETFYWHQDKWWRLATKSEVTGAVAEELSRCLAGGAPYRGKRSKHSNFPLVDVQAVVRAEFGASLKEQRRAAIQRVLARSARNASNAYAVKFNPLTGLLARDALNEAISRELSGLSEPLTSEVEVPIEGVLPGGLCVLALDIDHFKQVNDSYGHSYGDIVLRAFAIRLERAAKSYVEGLGTIGTTCAHVSGEEFFCIAWGAAENATFEGLADHLLRSVNGTPLPSASELTLLGRAIDPASITIPEERARTVTCSIGGVLTGPSASTNLKMTAERLLKQADLALYKSKGQGRNRATFFSTILHAGGRILEYDADVGIAAIDIGEEVGVVKGQEFFVYPPKFTGSHPFVIDDGRSKKVLANFPRAPLCRITAFDVQRQISFCRLSDQKFSSAKIPKDSQLEAIPLGALSTLIRDTGIGTPLGELADDLAGISDSQNRVSKELARGSKTSFAIVRIRNEAQVLEMYGPARVNRSLLNAFERLRRLPGLVFIGQLEPTQLLLEYVDFEDERELALDRALGDTENASGNRVNFVAGVCAGGRLQSERFRLPDSEAGKASVRVQLARYAAADEALEPKTRVAVFGARIAERVIARLRELREPLRGLADYHNFVHLGVESAYMDNVAGILAASLEDYPRAEALYRKAAALEPGVLVYQLNVVNSQLRQNHIEEACATAEAVNQDQLLRDYKKFPSSTASIAASFAERAKKTGIPEHVENARLWLERALALAQAPMAASRLRDLQGELGQ